MMPTARPAPDGSAPQEGNVKVAAATERCTVIVTPRDLFSVTETCLEHVFANTPEPFELVVVLGGAPPRLRRRLEERYAAKARLLFPPGFLTTPELRTLALRETRTRLAVCLDSNVFVRPGWLAGLVRCQEETGAALVVPLVLEAGDRIHTAGNDLFITYENGRAYGSMELRFHGHHVCESTNLSRRTIDFGEVHCQLVDVATALRTGIYAEILREGTDIDSGLTLSRAGHGMMVEPRSVVYLHYPTLVTDADDVRLHRWKWDIPAVMASYDRLKTKWNVDVGGPRAHFKSYLVHVNSRVGPFTQIRPTAVSARLDRLFLRLPAGLRSRFDAWRTGYHTAAR